MSTAEASRDTTAMPTWKRWVPWAVGVATMLAMLATWVLSILARNHPLPPEANAWHWPDLAELVSNLGVPILGILIARKSPSNPIGWLFLVAGCGLALANFGSGYAAYGLFVSPGLPLILPFALVGNTVWAVPISMLALLLALYPTGRPLTQRWRWFVRYVLTYMSVVLVLGLIVGAAAYRTPFASRPPPGLGRIIADIGYPVVSFGAVGMVLAGFVAAGLRFRRSRGEERLQMKWFTFAAVFVVITFVFNTGSSQFWQLASNLAILGLWVAIGIAMLKYRLYDVDVVIRRTLVAGVLIGCVTIVYVVIVAAVGVIGSEASSLRSGPVLAIATAIVAIAFQPLLRWARHLANRLVYGERATPYEVLSEFSGQMGETLATSDVPARMATLLGEGTGATSAAVWLYVGGQMRPEAVWPAGAVGFAPVPVPSGVVDPEIPGAGAVFPVRHRDELLGALSVISPPEEPLIGEREKLCTDLASQAGLVLRNVLLIEELQASRQRLVAAGDEERRKLERNIHDGAQQQLVALAIKIRLAKQLAGTNAPAAETMLDEVAQDATDALDNLRDLARGIYPPLLADKGLAAALEAQAHKAPIPTDIKADGISRYPQETEAAVYFCVLEGLQNIGKYAEASSVTISLRQTDGQLSFEVVDDGRGFDPNATGYGTGLQGIADRLAAAGGSLRVRSAPGQGTVLMGSLPVVDPVSPAGA